MPFVTILYKALTTDAILVKTWTLGQYVIYARPRDSVFYISYCPCEISLIRHSMGPENNVGLGGCWIMECLLPYSSMVTVSHIMVGLERMLDYRSVGLERFHCNNKLDNLHQTH